MLKEQLEKGREELDYINSVLDTVDRAENEKDLAQIREELTEQGYLKVQKGKKPRQTTLLPLEFESSDGFKILVGRNNRQNDKLTLKTASKNDMWLHTKDIHGSHVIVVSTAKRFPTRQSMRRHGLRHITVRRETAVRFPLTAHLFAMCQSQTAQNLVW